MSRLTDPENRACFYCDILKECDWDNTYDDCITVKYYDKLQHYEDLEEQGRLIEVVYGFDKSDYPSAFECSVCGFCDWDTYTADDGVYNYCPRCGAKIEELKGE